MDEMEMEVYKGHKYWCYRQNARVKAQTYGKCGRWLKNC